MMNSDGTFKEDIQCIVPQNKGVGAIFVSNLQAACNPITLKKHGIGAVITAIKGKNLSQKIPKHIEYMYIPVVDHQSCNISVFFKDSFEFIEEERKRTNVLVHCMAGVSRSVTLIIAYIMQKSGAPFDTVFKFVKSKRSIIHPNEAFVKQLVEHERRLTVKDDENRVKLEQSRIVSGFGKIHHQQENYGSKVSNISKLQDTHESWSKSSHFSGINNSSTQKQWLNKTKTESLVGDPNHYDKKLRENIKKLFNQSLSRVTHVNRNQSMR